MSDGPDEGSDYGPDDMVQVRLDSTGEVITVRAGDLQVREPESEDERPTPMEQDRVQEEENNVML